MSSASGPPDLHTLLFDIDGHVAVVTLNRPEVHNAFDELMQDELATTWQFLKHDEAVWAIVLTGAGDRAFCAGIDRSDIPIGAEFDPFTYDDPGRKIGPKSQGLWKPVVAAVNGMACRGAFYLLGESDVIIAADNATFFDPHVTYGMTASYEPILLSGRMAFGDLVRMTLTGTSRPRVGENSERVGLVTEVVQQADLMETASALAEAIRVATTRGRSGKPTNSVGCTQPLPGTGDLIRERLSAARDVGGRSPSGTRDVQ